MTKVPWSTSNVCSAWLYDVQMTSQKPCRRHPYYLLNSGSGWVTYYFDSGSEEVHSDRLPIFVIKQRDFLDEEPDVGWLGTNSDSA